MDTDLSDRADMLYFSVNVLMPLVAVRVVVLHLLFLHNRGKLFLLLL